jgi:hypothetical protein
MESRWNRKIGWSKPTHEDRFKTKSRYKSGLCVCAGGELNPHALRHMALNHACLPIPAPAQE